MGTGCPVCDGLSQIWNHCPECGAKMIDYGGVESYCDPYELYEELDDQTARDEAVTGDGQHVHLLQCPQCNGSVAYPVDEVLLI